MFVIGQDYFEVKHASFSWRKDFKAKHFRSDAVIHSRLGEDLFKSRAFVF